MNANYLSTCLLMLGAGMALAAPPRMAIDPNEPEKTRPTVSREEREKLGLTPHTWSGVVHPDAYARLDKLNRTVASLKDRLKKGRDVKAFDALMRVRFEGTMYVQVQLKDMDAQGRVLGGLKASEFHPEQLFEKSTGFTGYVSKDGLDKLAKNPDVTAVCLDDKPLPERPKPIYKNDLPPAKLGDTASAQSGVAEGKVDADVYRALNLSNRVNVIVSLRGESLPKGSDKSSEMRAREELREQEALKLQDRVLSAVSANEFWLCARMRGLPIISGFIDRDGLEKLWRHPDVRLIRLEELMQIPERGNGKHFSP